MIPAKLPGRGEQNQTMINEKWKMLGLSLSPYYPFPLFPFFYPVAANSPSRINARNASSGRGERIKDSPIRNP